MTGSAKGKFKDRVRRWADKLDTRVASITVRPMARKWASYSTAGRLTFDEGVVRLRTKLQDYVIVHELLHAHAPNHGRLWKSLMRVHLGDYERLDRELKRLVRSSLVRQVIGPASAHTPTSTPPAGRTRRGSVGSR